MRTSHPSMTLNVEDQIAVQPQASRRQPKTPNLDSVPVNGVQTYFRFCQPGGPKMIHCDDDMVVVSDMQLHPELGNGPASPAEEMSTFPYHRISMDIGPG